VLAVSRMRTRPDGHGVHIDRPTQSGARYERSDSGDRCTTGASLTGGSIYEVGWRFQPFRINGLEMVAQICPGWNRLQDWFELVGAFKGAP
jgi:hypothetical protein